MSGNIEYWRSQLHKADDECRRLKARAEKAEAALREILDLCPTEPFLPLTKQVVEIIRAALKKESK